MNRVRINLAVISLLGLAATSPAEGFWNAGDDFSITSNPSGPWWYGYTDGTAFQSSTAAFTGTIFDGWYGPGTAPAVMKNVWTDTAYGVAPGAISLECDFCAPVLRFTVPYDSFFDIFLQIGGTTQWTNGGFGNNWAGYGALTVNGSYVLEDSFVGNVKTWNRSLVQLHAGDFVEASMSGQHYGGGNTNTVMTLRAVPEPSSMLIFGLGLALIARNRR